MSEKTINFGNTKINNNNFYKTKRLFKIYDIDVDKILISRKKPYGKKGSFKYFIAYEDDYIGLSSIKLSQMAGYAKCFDNNKTMSFKVTGNNLLEKYTEIWKKVGSLMSIEFDSNPVYRH